MNSIGRIAALLLFGAALGCEPHHSMLRPCALIDDHRAAELLEQRCGTCHSTDRIYSSVGTPEEWAAVVHRMVYHHKAKLLTHTTDDEAATIARWLADNQKPDRGGIRIGFRSTGRPL